MTKEDNTDISLADYEAATFFEALAETIVEIYPTVPLQEQFLQKLMYNHMKKTRSETTDADFHLRRKVALEYLHSTLATLLSKYRS